MEQAEHLYKRSSNKQRVELKKHFESGEWEKYHEANRNANPEPAKKNVPVRDREKKPRNKGEEKKRKNVPESFDMISLNLGSDDDLVKRDICDFIQISSGVRNASIGRIDLKKDVTYVEIDSKLVDKVCRSLAEYNFDGKSIVVKRMD